MGGSPYRGGTLAANDAVDDRNYHPEKVRRKVAMELRSACHLVASRGRKLFEVCSLTSPPCHTEEPPAKKRCVQGRATRLMHGTVYPHVLALRTEATPVTKMR